METKTVKSGCSDYQRVMKNGTSPERKTRRIFCYLCIRLCTLTEKKPKAIASGSLSATEELPHLSRRMTQHKAVWSSHVILCPHMSKNNILEHIGDWQGASNIKVFSFCLQICR